MSIVQRNPIADVVIGAAIEVHRCLGPGLMESAYQACLEHEMRTRGLQVRREVPLPISFKGVQLSCGYRLDFLIEDSLIVEVKCAERFVPVHFAQVMTYLNLSDAKQALLFNFHCATLKEGIKSFLRSREDR